MTTTYLLRRSWADAYLPNQLQLLAQHFDCSVDAIRLATDDEDQTQATDAVLPNGRRVMLRMRKAEQAERFKGEFTIRTSKGRDGTPSEWEKVVEQGWGDYLLYGFAEGSEGLGSWWLIDLAAFRFHWAEGCCVKMPQEIEGDGCKFYAFRLDGFLSLPPLILATSEPLPLWMDGSCEGCRRIAASRRNALSMIQGVNVA